MTTTPILRPTHFLLSVLAALALLGVGARQANAVVFYVSAGGTGNGLSWATASNDLQGMIAAAHAGDQIWVKYAPASYVGNFTATDGVAVYGHFAGTETSISQRLLTNPAYATPLNANGSGTVYTVPSTATGTNTLDGFTVENGTNGGIRDASSDTLVVANCIVSNNSAQGVNGGGLYTQAVTATISNCFFSSNIANAADGQNIAGGAVYAAGTTTVTISNCYFTGNSAAPSSSIASGSGVSAGGTTTISSSAFSSNTASNAQSAVNASGAALTVSGCTFTGNTGGGITAICTTNTISNCTFTNNSGRGVTVGGASASTLTDCAFTGNSITGGNGGALYTGSVSTILSGCTFTGNTAKANASQNVYGGGVYTEVGTTTAVSDCTFDGNSATPNSSTAYGGGVGGFGTPSITNCTFTANSPDQIDLENAGNPPYDYATIKENLLYGSGTSGGNGINLALQGTSTTFVYAIVANNTIVNTNIGINIGAGSNTSGVVDVANNLFYGNNGGVSDNASVTFVSSHNDLSGNAYTYQGVSLNPTDLTADPTFVRNPNFNVSPVDDGDLHLQSASLLINAGDNSYVASGETDRDGNPRIRNSHVEIGCYESPINEAAHLSSLSPSTAQAGTAGFTLTVTGTGFVSGVIVDWNSTALTTKFVSATQVTAVVPASLVATAGTAAVTVVNPGATASNSLSFTTTAAPIPVPALTSVSPTSAIAGAAAFTLTVTGTKFAPSSLVKWNGAAQATTFVSATQLTASIPAALLVMAGSIPITVSTSAGGTSSAVSFTVNPVPVIVSLAPSSAAAGGPTFTLTVNGKGFLPNSLIQWKGSSKTTTYVSATQLTTSIPASLIASVGTAAVTVMTPNVATSNSETFTVNPKPVVTTLSPTTIKAGSAVFTLTVTGTGFLSSSLVQWNGATQHTTFVSATELTASIPASLVATVGTATVTVTTPNVATSNSETFTINPAPVVTALSPASAKAGGPTFTLTVTGTGFLSNSVVQWSGVTQHTTFVSATKLTTSISASLIATAGPKSVTIMTPNVATSKSVTFTINPVPAVTTLSPISIKVGSAAFTLTVTGTGFLPTSVVQWKGTNLTTKYEAATKLTVTVPASLIVSAGTAAVIVTTPGVATSNSETFTVSAIPVIASLTPASAIAGSAAFTLTVTGTGFLSTSVIKWNGISEAATYVSTTKLTATIPASLLIKAGTATVTVTTPNVATSNSEIFTINPIPMVTALSPASAVAGGTAFTLTVNGTGFLSTSVIKWNGVSEATTYVSATKLTVPIPASWIATAHTVQVTVTTPGVATSNSVSFTVNPKPVIISLSPSRIPAGSVAFTLTVTGTGFLSTSVVKWKGTALTTTEVSGTELTAYVPSSLLIYAGTAAVTVTTPGVATSNSVTFTLTP